MRGATLLLLVCIAVRLSRAGATPDPLPWKVNTPIVSVRKEVYKKCPRPRAAALVNVAYVGPNLARREVHSLELRDDVHSSRGWRLSRDNGRTWTKLEPLPSTDRYYKGVEVWEGAGPVLHDRRAGVLVDTWLRQIAVKGLYHQCTYYRISRDHGRTWTTPKQLRYEEGDDFDPASPLNPSFLSRNQAYFGSNILPHSNGTLIHPVAHANAPGDPRNDKRSWRMGSLCFIGKWDPDTKDYHWTAGKRVEISPTLSSRGLMEPAAAELNGGRVLVVWRGSNTPKTPGRKWFSLSTDGGRTLSTVQEWKYDDGSRFYSPSSLHRFIRHSVTGKLCWVGNISAVKPSGNWPRYPLIIAEVDERLAAIKKRTVSAIDDRKPPQTTRVQFSNFSLLENRETHALELYLTAYAENADDWRTANCYKYTVTLK